MLALKRLEDAEATAIASTRSSPASARPSDGRAQHVYAPLPRARRAPCAAAYEVPATAGDGGAGGSARTGPRPATRRSSRASSSPSAARARRTVVRAGHGEVAIGHTKAGGRRGGPVQGGDGAAPQGAAATIKVVAPTQAGDREEPVLPEHPAPPVDPRLEAPAPRSCRASASAAALPRRRSRYVRRPRARRLALAPCPPSWCCSARRARGAGGEVQGAAASKKELQHLARETQASVLLEGRGAAGGDRGQLGRSSPRS